MFSLYLANLHDTFHNLLMCHFIFSLRILDLPWIQHLDFFFFWLISFDLIKTQINTLRIPFEQTKKKPIQLLRIFIIEFLCLDSRFNCLAMTKFWLAGISSVSCKTKLNQLVSLEWYLLVGFCVLTRCFDFLRSNSIYAMHKYWLVKSYGN